MADVLYCGPDDRIEKIMTAYYAEMKKKSVVTNSLIHVQDERRLQEAMIAMIFDLIIFEQKILTENLYEFPEVFRGARAYKGKLVLAGDESDPSKLQKLLEAGWVDYFVMPPDRPLIIEKVELYASGSRTASRQVYSLALFQSTDVARPCYMEELSEFGCKLKSPTPFKMDELTVLYTKAISSDGDQVASVMARCFHMEEHPKAKGFYLSQFSFVGVKADILQNIRNQLRKAYASSKGR